MIATKDKNAPSGVYTRFGYITGHALPWEGYRIGKIVERPVEELGHGLICGGTGSGKTVAAYPVIYYPVVGCGWGAIVIDFKASAKTREATRAAATAANKPFICLQVGTQTTHETPVFYEPFAWEGTPEEKASMLLSCLDLPTEGAASHYSGLAQRWLRFCFHLLNHTAPRANESTMDFIIRMFNVAEANAVLKDIHRSDETAHDHLISLRGPSVTNNDLEGVRARIQNIASPLAPNLTPSTDDPRRGTFDPMQIGTNGAVAYISISAANESVVKGVGSLIIEHLTSIMQVRMRGGDHTPMILFIDEASALGEKAILVETLFKQGREARIWTWLATQQLSAWLESVQTAILGNTSTIIALRSDDSASAEQLSANAGFGIIEVERREVTARGAIGGEKQTMGGSKQRIAQPGEPLITPQEFQELPNYSAYIWFKYVPGVDTGSGRSKRRPPATPRDWTKNPRLRKGWEYGFTYDTPIVRIVPPAIMLKAANQVSEASLPSTPRATSTTSEWNFDPTTPPQQHPLSPAPQAQGFGTLAAPPPPTPTSTEEDELTDPPITPFSTSRRPTPTPTKRPRKPVIEVLDDEPREDDPTQKPQDPPPPASAPAGPPQAADPWAPVVDDD